MDSFLRHVISALVLLAGLCSCSHDPIPARNIPDILMTESLNVTDSSATLRALISNMSQAGDYGFKYGILLDLSDASTLTVSAAGLGDGSVSAEVQNLSPSTTYYFQAYVRQGRNIINGDVNSFTTLKAPDRIVEPDEPEVPDEPQVPDEPDGPSEPPAEPPSEPEPVVQEAVDLGLSIKWSNMNLGAIRPEYSGDLYAWGEHSQKDSYSWENYVFKASDGSFTKYNVDTSHGNLDYRIFLDLADDPAVYAINSRWRTPTYAEWEELRDGCDWVWTDDYSGTGVPGFIVSGRGAYSENSIFLPEVAGSDGVPIGHYWTSELLTSDSRQAYCFSFLYDCTAARMLGYPIRPVTGDPALVQATSMELGIISETMYLGEEELGKIYKMPSLHFEPENVRSRTILWDVTDSDILEMDDAGICRIKGYGVCEIVATLLDGGLTASFTLEVSEPLPDLSVDKSGSGEDYGFEYVDLGLSVKWAGFNLGADKYYHRGSYYTWADIHVFSGKSLDDWDSYRFYEATAGKLTKYVVREEDGPVDNLTVIEACDDAATLTLGSDWHIPTSEEWQELNDNCDWLLVKNLGIKGTEGYIVTSRVPGYEDKAIFLPIDDYWTSCMSPDFDSRFAYYFWKSPQPFEDHFIYRGSWRCSPKQIRPVKK